MKKTNFKKEFIFFSLALLLFFLVGFVQAGCCYDSSSGICSEGGEEQSCTDLGGSYSDSSCSSIGDCSEACCILGLNTRMTNAKSCELLSSSLGFSYPDNFEQITAAECSAVNASQELGACILVGDYRECRLTTQAMCNSSQFYSGKMCTSPELNTTCRKTTNTILVSGKDEVYFVDSCGNKANIYDASKINDNEYWTRFFSKSESCNPSQNNAGNVACGNCNYNLSSVGKRADSTTGTPTYGSNICVDLGCYSGEEIDGYWDNFDHRGWFFVPRKGTVTEWTQTQLNNPFPTRRENGESWCYFDSPAPGTNQVATEDVNVPGSRYYRRYCLNGKVITEPCGDKRTEYCNQGECIKADYENCFMGTDRDQCPTNSNKNMGCGFGTGPDSVFMRGNENGNNAGQVYVFFANYRDLYQQVNPPGFASTSAWGGEFHSPLLMDLDLNHCFPWFSPGTTNYCSFGDQQITATFKRVGSEWTVYREDTGTGDCGDTWGRLPALTGMDMSGYCYNDLGKAGIFDLDPDAWTPSTYPDFSNFNYMDPAAVEELRIQQQGGGTSTATPNGQGNTGDIGDMTGIGGGFWLPLKNFITKIFQPILSSVSAKPFWCHWGWCGGSGGGTDNMKCTAQNQLGLGCSLVQEVYDGSRSSLPVDEKVIKIMNNDCIWFGDCSGEPNYLGVGGNSGSISGMSCHKSGTDTVECSFNFECSPWKAPSGGDCEKCGSDQGTYCSEYKCKSIASNCVYHATGGLSGGYCKRSDDNIEPIITAVNVPTLPVEPYSAVNFVIRTNEMATCRFDFNTTANYSSLRYNFGNSLNTQHSLTLYPPGNAPTLDSSTRAYGLIRNDGNYSMYVRCQDAVGNFNSQPFIINFQVMQNPDTRVPSITNMSPSSGSSIQFNTTTKIVSMRINEPSQCKWSFSDKIFGQMENDFACDEYSTVNGFLTGNYTCWAYMTNITLNLTQQTKFYIRCKDQPWLEGKEDNNYKRNEMSPGREYILKPSDELVLGEVSPSGSVVLGAGESFNLRAVTARGALNGIAKCYWKIGDNTNQIFTVFNKTNSNIHQKSMINVSDGNYLLQVKCEDGAGNIVYKNSTYSVSIDRSAPIIKRIYQTGGSLKIKTNEVSTCYYTINNKAACSWSLGNMTLMSGSEKDHNAQWTEKSTYYIKCKDYRGNSNSGCGLIVKTY